MSAGMVLGESAPHHRLGLPPTDHPTTGAAELGIDLDARPSYAEMVKPHADRTPRMRGALAALDDNDLAQIRTAAPTPA